MDEGFLRRGQAIGALLIVVAYFLPWASILSPFGTVQLRGLYVDYSWIVLVLAIGHLTSQFAEVNKDSLGIPESWTNHIGLFRRIAPFAFIAFFAWYGAQFAFTARNSVPGTVLFGIEVASLVKAGLDYGYWLGLTGSVLLLLITALHIKKTSQFVTSAVLLTALVCGLAFGFTKVGRNDATGKKTEASHAPILASSNQSSAAEQPAAAEPELDSSPYVEVVSIAGRHLGKDYEESRYGNSVVIGIVFKNVGTKSIVGLRGRMSVLDGFGTEVYGFNFRDDDKLAPGKQSRQRGGYSFEDNQFSHDEPYDKIQPLITGGTARYSAKITRIAFDDGTVLPQTTPSK